MWRPENWANPYKHPDAIQAWDVPEAYKETDKERYDDFEAGADAMARKLAEWEMSDA